VEDGHAITCIGGTHKGIPGIAFQSLGVVLCSFLLSMLSYLYNTKENLSVTLRQLYRVIQKLKRTENQGKCLALEVRTERSTEGFYKCGFVWDVTKVKSTFFCSCYYTANGYLH
jgi:hypothetical protein